MIHGYYKDYIISNVYILYVIYKYRHNIYNVGILYVYKSIERKTFTLNNVKIYR